MPLTNYMKFDTNPKIKFLIDNFFITFNGQNLFCQVCDTQNRLVFINDYFIRQQSNLNQENALGLTLEEFTAKHSYEYFAGYNQKLTNLYDLVLETRQRKSFFAYARDKDNREYIRLANIFPLLAADGELLGTYTLSWFANPFNFLLNFQSNMLIPASGVDSTVKDRPNLSKREHQVLFLLIHNFSQYEIGNYLGIARGTVQKIINDKLCGKFDINPPSSEYLVKKAIELGLHIYFPPSLLGSRIIELNNDESKIRSIAELIAK